MSSSRPVFRSRWLPYLLVAPQLIITVIFFIWPAGEALWYSLQSVDPFGFSSQFVGLDNFVTLFHDSYYLDAFWTTIKFSTFVTVSGLLVSLFFAALGWMNAKTGFSLGVWVLLLMPVMSWLLISPVRMFAFKFRSFSFKGNEIRYLFIALSVVLLVALGVRAVPVIILLYIVVSAVKWIVTLKSRDSAACPEE